MNIQDYGVKEDEMLESADMSAFEEQKEEEKSSSCNLKYSSQRKSNGMMNESLKESVAMKLPKIKLIVDSDEQSVDSQVFNGRDVTNNIHNIL